VEQQIDDGLVNVVAVTGGGDRVFVSGGDLRELAQVRTEAEATQMSRNMRNVLDRIASLVVPTVAVLNGDAYGGGAEVAVSCDLRLAADDIRIAFNQVALGIMPAWGGVERLTTLVGRGRALQLLLTGRVLHASTAAEIGLIEEIVARESLQATAQALLEQLAAVPRTPARSIKKLVNSLAPACSPDLESAATSAFAQAWVSDEHWEAAAAAEQRRAAVKAARSSS
jgi:enoyl-CoA hydratase/carnithine racemase